MTQTLRDALVGRLGYEIPADPFVGCELVERRAVGPWFLDDLVFDPRRPETEAAAAQDPREPDRIPGYFLRPPPGHDPVAAVVYAHAHGNTYAVGRDELIQGRGALVAPYAEDLVQAGIAALCLDMPAFGARQDPSESARAKSALWRGQTLFGQMLSELSSAVSFLREQDGIDPDRIGVMGFSMGSTHAWWLAVLDPRIRAAVAMCSFADLGHLVETGAHDGHGIYMTVPGLLDLTSTSEIASLAAPKPMLIAAGYKDWSTPERAFRTATDPLRRVYQAADAADCLEFYVDSDLGHLETPAMRASVLSFLKRRL